MFVCSFAFAKETQINDSNKNAESLLDHQSISNYINSTTFNHYVFAPCTVTVTINWYNEYGVYQGSTSSTVTYSAGSNTGLNCVMASHLAENAAENLP